MNFFYSHITNSKLKNKKLQSRLTRNRKIEVTPWFIWGFQPPYSRHRPLDPACSPLLKSLLRYFRQFPHLCATPSCPNPTNQPSLVSTNIKRVILLVQLLLSIKNQFLIFKIPLQIGYLNLWDIFRFGFRQLHMTFFHKIMVAENTLFLWMHDNFAKDKKNLNVKMTSFEKIK